MKCIFEAAAYSYNGEGIYEDNGRYFIRKTLDRRTRETETEDIEVSEREAKKVNDEISFDHLGSKIVAIRNGTNYLASYDFQDFELEVKELYRPSNPKKRFSLGYYNPHITNRGWEWVTVTQEEAEIAINSPEEAFAILQKHEPVEINFEHIEKFRKENHYQADLFRQIGEDNKFFLIVKPDNFWRVIYYARRVEISKEDVHNAQQNPDKAPDIFAKYLLD